MQGIVDRIIAWWLKQTGWHALWIPVAVSMVLSELIVAAMSWLLLRRVDGGYLLTGLAASGLVSLAVCAALFAMLNRLQESESRLSFLVSNSPAMLFILSPTPPFEATYVSPNVARDLGYRSEQFTSDSGFWAANLHPDDRERAAADLAQLSGQGTLRREYRFRASDGGYRWMRDELRLIRNAAGEATRIIGYWTDVTEHRQAEELLRKSSAEFADIYNNAPCGYHSLDREGVVQRINDTELAWLGYARDEVAGKMKWSELLSPASRQAFRMDFSRFMQQGFTRDFEIELLRRDGTTFMGLVNASAIYDAKGDFVMSRSSVFDITARKRAEEATRINASVFSNAQEAIIITDADNTIIDVNPSFTRITGYSREETVGHNPRLLSSGRQSEVFYTAMWQALQRDGVWRGELWNRRKSGEVYPEMLSISAVCDDDGKVIRHVAVFSDITRNKQHEEELRRIAHFDTLTGIPNRLLLADRMRHAIARTIREQTMMAVCYLDLDGFKPINDMLGHDAGDEVLIQIAGRIGGTIRGGDTVARLGGDEFVVLLLGLEQGGECVATLERLLAVIAEPIIVKNQTHSVSASIGVSIYPLDDEDPDTLLRHADQAMYVAKQAGRNRFHIYDPSLDQRARDQHAFLKSIRHGLEHNEFELFYQPKINLRTREMVGAEALIRWRHPERGVLPPSEFLRYVEHTDLDISIGEWVMQTALARMESWRRAGLDIEVSINISGHHLEAPGFVDNLRRQLANYPDLPPGRLQIEVLETVALNDIAIVRGIIESCRAAGVKFALDDFGTGYSSLSYLSSLPVDELKIDRSFVRDMLDDKGATAIVQGVIALARAFDRRTVAEGIETVDHYQALLDMGCELGQGYVIARPMPADELTTWKVSL